MTESWYLDNQKYLALALADLGDRLEFFKNGNNNDYESDRKQRLDEISNSMSSPPALENICRQFRLSPFEKDILLLCAGVELESNFSSILASIQALRPYPTFSLALAALEDPHWSALSPASPLRHWHLIMVEAGASLTTSPIRIDERVLHYLAGVQHFDERLAGMIEPIEDQTELVPSQRLLAERLAAIWMKADTRSRLPVIQLCGEYIQAKKDIAIFACGILGMKLCSLSAKSIPQAPNDLDTLIRLWERDCTLSTSALFLDCDDIDQTYPGDLLRKIVDRARYPLIVSARTRKLNFQSMVATFDVAKPSQIEQREFWEKMAGQMASRLDGQMEAIVSEFDLNTHDIQNAWSEVSNAFELNDSNLANIKEALWRTCRCQARHHLEDLATRIEPAANWNDLVLPQGQKRILKDIAAHVRNRAKVYGDWGFSRKISYGMGISVLFSGASGTGKTMAAEVLANELCLDLYRIDLSSVVSKYIGETEKNLKRVFDAAEQGGTILLFDEADALFGRRSEVKDSHDRYANIEISYLLQRMEAYRGLAILTTNMKGSLDPAFMRRIRFSVQFPFPDYTQRAEIWKRIFPADAPTESLDINKLAKLNVAGGNVRNIALYAAFLAADENKPIGMEHLFHAAQIEYAKLEKPLTEAEVGGWI